MQALKRIGKPEDVADVIASWLGQGALDHGASIPVDGDQALEEADIAMNRTVESKNKALVLEAFDTLFNKRNYAAAESFWSPHYIPTQRSHCSGRGGPV